MKTLGQLIFGMISSYFMRGFYAPFYKNKKRILEDKGKVLYRTRT